MLFYPSLFCSVRKLLERILASPFQILCPFQKFSSLEFVSPVNFAWGIGLSLLDGKDLDKKLDEWVNRKVKDALKVENRNPRG